MLIFIIMCCWLLFVVVCWCVVDCWFVGVCCYLVLVVDRWCLLVFVTCCYLVLLVVVCGCLWLCAVS